MSEIQSRSGIPMIFGEVLFDHFPDGNRVMGGAPFNVAWNLQGFGFSPLLLSAVGADSEAERVRSTMSQWGMASRYVQTVEDRPTGRVEITHQNGEPTYEIVTDQAFDEIALPTGLGQDGIDLLYFGSLACRGEANQKTLRRVKDQLDSKVFVDVNVREGHFEDGWADEFLPGISSLKCNADEIERLAIGRVDATGGMTDIARRLLDHFEIQELWLTQGSEGASWIDRGGKTYSASPTKIEDADLVDTVGAGDAFASVVIAGILSQQSPQDILQDAVRHSARVCTLQGATTTDRSFYRLT